LVAHQISKLKPLLLQYVELVVMNELVEHTDGGKAKY
jgi:hypothetical protein